MRPYCSKQSLVWLLWLCVVFLGPALVRVSPCCLQIEREAEFSLAIFCLSRSFSASVKCLTARTVKTLTPEDSVPLASTADPKCKSIQGGRGQLVANGALQDSRAVYPDEVVVVAVYYVAWYLPCRWRWHTSRSGRGEFTVANLRRGAPPPATPFIMGECRYLPPIPAKLVTKIQKGELIRRYGRTPQG